MVKNLKNKNDVMVNVKFIDFINETKYPLSLAKRDFGNLEFSENYGYGKLIEPKQISGNVTFTPIEVYADTHTTIRGVERAGTITSMDITNKVKSIISRKIQASLIIEEFVNDSEYNGGILESYEDLKKLISEDDTESTKFNGFCKLKNIKTLILRFDDKDFSVICNPILTKNYYGNLKILIYLRTYINDKNAHSLDTDDFVINVQESLDFSLIYICHIK